MNGTPSERVLQSDVAVATFAEATGALIGFTNLETGWNVVRRSELGLSFRLLVPLPGRRNNSVFGVQQSPPTVEQDESGITFEWAGVTSQHGGTHAITVVQRYRLDGAALRVETSVRNDSDLIVENVFSPYLGDLRPSVAASTLSAIRHDYGSGMIHPLWPKFENSVGYYGVDVPTQLAQRWMPGYGTPVVPYTLIQEDEEQGLYIGVSEPTSELVAWHTELWPGYEDSMESSVPLAEHIAGVPVRIQFAAVHVPYVLPGEARTLTPLTMQFYVGDWHAGAEVYAAWRERWLKPTSIPDWVSEPHQWHQLQINSAEDELRIPFSSLVDVGREAAEAGVAAIQLVGFNDGGQDRNNPSHAPDQRLGGFEELKSAIAQVQALGVRVILFAKFTWADRTTDDFRSTWIDQAVKDPYGDYYLHPGYKYETVTQVLDINTHRLIPMCFLAEPYLQECVRQFRILLDLGADGILFDEAMHHLPTLLCFDTTHGHRYGAPTYANDLELIRRFRSLIPDREDFLFAGEALYDWQFDQYALSYHRSENPKHLPLHRLTAARQQMMTAVTGFNDRNMINQSLLYRYIVSYEPYNFKGRLTDFPQTIAYGRQMEDLRRETRAWTWDGVFTDTVGASVIEADGTRLHPYSVFESAEGTRAVVVANYGTTGKSVTVQIDGHDGLLWAKAVDGGEWATVPGGALDLAPRSAVVLLQTDPH